MTFRNKYRALSLVSIAAVVFAAVALSAKTTVEQNFQSAKTGVVLDAATQQPVPGVYVVARWLEQTTQPALLGAGGKVQGQCVFRAITRTDSQGRYSIPASSANFNLTKNWQPGSSRKYFWDLYTYANGYAATANIISQAHPTSIADTLLGDDPQTLQPILLTTQHAACSESSSATCDERRRVALQRVGTPVASASALK
jgi:hypothetical protein